MESNAKTLAINVDGSVHPIQFLDPADSDRLAGSLAEGRQVRIQVAADGDVDTEGHSLATAAVARISLDDDDTEGHAIAIHFPTAGDAKEFRNRLLVTGAIVGSVTIASLGAGAALSQAPGIGTAAPGSGAAGQEVSDSWSRMGVPGTAAAANAAADELRDSWQNANVPGTAAANNAAADELTDSWQNANVPGTAAANNAAADELTDSWQNMGVTGSAGQAPPAEDEANPEDTNAFGAGREFREK